MADSSKLPPPPPPPPEDVPMKALLKIDGAMVFETNLSLNSVRRVAPEAVADEVPDDGIPCAGLADGSAGGASLAGDGGGAGSAGGGAGGAVSEAEDAVVDEADVDTFLIVQGELHVVQSPDGGTAAATTAGAADTGTTGLTFLQIGLWTYPLVGQPAMRVSAGSGKYILPDTSGSRHFMLQVPASAAGDVDAALTQFLQLRDRETGELVVATSLSDKLAKGIVVAGDYVAAGLVRGAGYVGSGISWTGRFLKSKLPQREKPVEVSERTHSVVRTARGFTDSAVLVSGGLVQAVGRVASMMGSAISDNFASTSLGKKFNDKSSSRTGKAVKAVALSSAVAFGTIWDAMDVAAKQIASDTAHATHTVVRHRYGEDAGKLAHEAGNVGKGLLAATLNMKRVGIKPLVKLTARDAARKTIEGSGSASAASGASAAADTGSAPAVILGVSGDGDVPEPPARTSSSMP